VRHLEALGRHACLPFFRQSSHFLFRRLVCPLIVPLLFTIVQRGSVLLPPTGPIPSFLPSRHEPTNYTLLNPCSRSFLCFLSPSPFFFISSPPHLISPQLTLGTRRSPINPPFSPSLDSFSKRCVRHLGSPLTFPPLCFPRRLFTNLGLFFLILSRGGFSTGD